MLRSTAPLFLWLTLIPYSQASQLPPLESLLGEARHAQRLVSAFDLKLEKVTHESDLDRLQSSGLYCRILEARATHERLEENLIALVKTAIGERKESEIFAKLFAFGRTDPASAATIGQVMNLLQSRELEICGAINCLNPPIGKELPFSPSVGEEFAAFLEDQRAKIAQPSDPQDDLPGECFTAFLRRTEYDWDKRSWISGNLSNGEFVVTYDDGPHPEYTQLIQTAWLATSFAKPTFFWLSENSARFRELVQSTHRQGFPVACHSERHADLGNLAKAANASKLSKVNRETFGEELKNVSSAEFPAWKSRTLDREILGAARTLEEIVREVDPAYRVKHFRLPFGSGLKNSLIGDRFSAADLDHFFWRVDSLDWQDKNSASVHKRVISQMKSGKKGIILFHDIQAPTVATTKLLLDTFAKSGEWKPVSIRQMVP